MTEQGKPHYTTRKITLGEPTGKFYRRQPGLEYRLVMCPHGIHVYITTNGGFPAWEVTEEPFLSWKQAKEWFENNVTLCDKCEIDRSQRWKSIMDQVVDIPVMAMCQCL